MRLALGVSYRGSSYNGWQSQPDGNTVQDRLERALGKFAGSSMRSMCAGRTDAGVHGLNQVVHLETEVQRELQSWVRGTNRYLPDDVAVQWARLMPDGFHARNSALGRRYAYLLLQSAVRPSIEQGVAGWVFRSLSQDVMEEAARLLIGQHDFSAFRSAECQAASPVKIVRRISISRRGAYWRFDFDANAFLHHMVRNIMGCLVAVGSGSRSVAWLAGVIESRNRAYAAPTFPADGLYFVGPYYDASLAVPEHTPAMDWLL